MTSDHELNRLSWNILAEAHGQDAYYDSRALLAGESSLIAEEEEALQEAIGEDLENLAVLHLQCHLGFDAITLARRGARVTGVDFSHVALAKAHSLANTCAVDVEWICADVLALPESLHRRFDLVWATVGIICWIADLNSWMTGLSNVLKPGGRLVLLDGFPDAASYEPSPTRRYIEAGWDYATDLRTGPQVQFRHTIDDVTAAVEAAGLTILSFRKHLAITADLRIAKIERGEDGLYRRFVGGEARPILFTMVAMQQGCDSEGAAANRREGQVHSA